MHYSWDAEIGAHDVELVAGAGMHLGAPEGVRLRCVLDQVYKDVSEGSAVNLEPVRKLVAALVASSGRHTLHGTGPPTMGKHACARGAAECPPAERTRYKQEAQRWRGVTGRMADLE